MIESFVTDQNKLKHIYYLQRNRLCKKEKLQWNRHSSCEANILREALNRPSIIRNNMKIV